MVPLRGARAHLGTCWLYWRVLFGVTVTRCWGLLLHWERDKTVVNTPPLLNQPLDCVNAFDNGNSRENGRYWGSTIKSVPLSTSIQARAAWLWRAAVRRGPSRVVWRRAGRHLGAVKTPPAPGAGCFTAPAFPPHRTPKLELRHPPHHYSAAVYVTCAFYWGQRGHPPHACSNYCKCFDEQLWLV